MNKNTFQIWCSFNPFLFLKPYYLSKFKKVFKTLKLKIMKIKSVSSTSSSKPMADDMEVYVSEIVREIDSFDQICRALNIDFNYLQEKNHIGDKDYFKSKFTYNNNNGIFSFETKRNLITNSSEFYDLSYEYINDCLTAGVAFRREFYRDRDIEPDDSLIFKVTFSPLGTISTPEY